MEEGRAHVAAPRGFAITREDLEKHGYTKGCPGCNAIIRKTSKQRHSQACRVRMEEAMKGEDKVERARRKCDEMAAEAMERADVLRRRKNEELEARRATQAASSSRGGDGIEKFELEAAGGGQGCE